MQKHNSKQLYVCVFVCVCENKELANKTKKVLGSLQEFRRDRKQKNAGTASKKKSKKKKATVQKDQTISASEENKNFHGSSSSSSCSSDDSTTIVNKNTSKNKDKDKSRRIKRVQKNEDIMAVQQTVVAAPGGIYATSNVPGPG